MQYSPLWLFAFTYVVSNIYLFNNIHPQFHSSQQSIREMVTEKYNRQEEYLTGMIKQRQEAVDDHISGRKLMKDEVSISIIH